MQKRSTTGLPRLALAAFLTVLVASPAIAAVSPGHQVIVSDDPADWTPHVQGGQVNAIVVAGNKVIVGGDFTQVRRANTSTFLPRNFLFAFDRTTGAIDTAFVPVLDGAVETLALAPNGQSVFVGGLFNAVNGITRRKVALLSTANGQLVTAFQANASAKVLDLAVVGTRLFMAGAFATVKGVPAQGLAAVDTTTGNVDPGVNFTFTNPRSGTQRVLKIDVTLDGTRLVAIGNFQLVSGLDRKQIALFDLTTSPVTIANWHTNQFAQVVPGTTTAWCSAAFDTYMRDVSFSPDGSFFIVGTTGAYRANRLCDTITRWPTAVTGSDLMPTWVDWSGGDTTTAVAVTETAVYVGGHQRWWNNPYEGDDPGPGAVPREGIAALDPVNGLPFRWDPGRDRGVGVFAFLPTPDGLWVGSDTDTIGGEFHGELALMPLAGGTAVPTPTTIGLPNNLHDLELGGAMVRRSYDGSSFGPEQTVATGINWGTARGAFVLNGLLYYGLSDGRLYSRTFDGTNVGPPVAIGLHGLEVQPPSAFLIPGTTTRVPALTTHLANASGMFYDQGRLYYTVRNEPRLYYRYFSLESQVIGANLFVASTTPSVNWSQVAGMTLAGGQLYLGSTTGNLSRIAFSNGVVSGSASVVGGPAIDGYTWNTRGIFLFGPPAGGGDTVPPTTPGQPGGSSGSPSTISLTWGASSDNVSTLLTYRIFRDGGTSPVGTVTSASTTTVAFTDTGLAPGTTHTYRIDARDAALNTSAPSTASAPITTMSGGGAIFADAFTSGSFAAWTTVSNLSIDNTSGGAGPPSARGVPSNQPAFARRDLGTTLSQVCLSEAVNLSAPGASVSLMRLRTATGGPIARAFVNTSGVLVVRSDVAGTQQSSGTPLPAGWNQVELCGTVGSAGAWTLYLNGSPIVSGWVANTGTTGVGRIEIGDTDPKTWSGNFDDVVLDTTPG